MSTENKHHRRSIRLPHYDYADEGAYFVTICTYERVCLFGYVDNEVMTLNTFGRMVWDEWENTAKLRDNVTLDRFVVMPNHVHGIIWITEDTNQDKVANPSVGIQHETNQPRIDNTKSSSNVGAWRDESNNSEQGNNLDNVGAQRAAPLHPRGMTPNNVKSGSLGAIVRAFKSVVTKRINAYRNTPGSVVWQRNYWERVIRTNEDLNWLRFYIDTNPAQWQKDKLYISKSDILK